MHTQGVETTYAYLAGIIDADGHITVSKANRRLASGTVATYFTPRVGITGTRNAPHELAKTTFGGSLSRQVPKDPAHRLVWFWAIEGGQAAAALRLLLPYLRVKVEQAKVAIELAEVLAVQAAAGRHRPVGQRVTAEMTAERERLWHAVGALNEPRNRRVHFA